MNKIVRHFPISELPEGLREGLPQDAQVTVRLDVEERPKDALTLEQIIAMRQPVFETGEAADAYVGSMRDEWD